MEESTKGRTFKKVMIVDDNEIDRYIAARNITKFGFGEEVIQKESATNGLNFLRSLEQSTGELPELIFLDIRMPEIDGFGFLDGFDKLPEEMKKNIIIVMLSTSLDPDDHEKAKNNKCVSTFLNKPLDKEKLESLSLMLTHKNGSEKTIVSNQS